MSSVSQSRSFLMITAAVSILLLVALIAVVVLTLRTEYTAIPTATLRPTDSPSLTTTEAPSEAFAQDSFADLIRLDSVGFAYRPPLDYAESQSDNSVTFTSEGDDGQMAPTFLLSGGPRTQFVDQEHESLDDAFAHFVDFFAERDNFDVRDAEPLVVDGVDARSVELVSQDSDASFAGRIVMAQPDEDRLFVMTGVAPQESWERTASDLFSEVLTSVVFFAPESSTPLLVPTQTHTATPLPTATPTPIPLSMPMPTPNLENSSADVPSLYSNANFIRELAPAGNTLWAASDGGIIAWNQRSGGQIKFTALDGLAGNHFRTASNCPLPGLGIVFGNELGLQIFDARNGTWNALNRENSAMHFNDVSVVRCYPAFDFAVVGYEQNGLDIYDATTNEWQSIGPADGLSEETVEDIAVIGDRDAIWVSSGRSLTALANGQPALYNENNSPLTSSRIGALKTINGDTLWIGETGTAHRIQDGQWLAYSADTLTGRFPTGLITGIDDADAGQVWLATDEGEVCRFDPEAIECIEYYEDEAGMPLPPYTDLATLADGSLVVSTDGAGLGTVDGATWSTRTIDGEFLADNSVWDMVQTRDGFLWIAVDSGLQQMDPNRPAIQRLYTFEANNLPIENVRVLNIDGGGLWIGGQGAAQQQGDEWRIYSVENGLAGSTVKALAVDGQLRTWLGTESGLSIWNGDSFFNLTAANGLPSDDIPALLADGNTMWIGSNGGGLYRFTSNQLRIFDAAGAGLPSDVITALGLGRDGAIWVGTDQGLALFENDKATLVSDLPTAPITDIYTANVDGSIDGDTTFVGVHNRGVFRFDGAAWVPLATENLQPSGHIESILMDEMGTLWLGGADGGLVRIKNDN